MKTIDRREKERTLRQLLEDNFVISGFCRRTMEQVNDVSLKYYFQNIAARRSQFAMEIEEEISYHFGGEPYIPSGAYGRNRKESKEFRKIKAIKKAVKFHKDSLQKYKEALCHIHDGSCREVLLRHKSFIEHCIFELNAIKTLIKYNHQEDGELKRA